MAYGVTITGFNKKTIDAILQDLETEAQAQFGTTVDLTSTSPLKMMLEAVAVEIARIWDMAENIYDNGFVDYAGGINLDRLGAIVDVLRQSATQSTGTVTFTGVAATVIPVGSRVSTNEGLEYQTTAAGIVGGGGTVDIAVESLGYGEEYNAGAGLIVNLVTPIVGITSVVNAAATVGGSDKESDASYRDRVKGALTGFGKGTLEAIILAVRAVSGVTGCSGTEDLNNHTVQLYVSGSPSASDVDDAIEDSKPAGIEVSWSPVTGDTVNITLNITTDTAARPGDWDTRIEDSITAYIQSLGAGEDVIWSSLMDAVYDAEEVDGVSQGWIETVPRDELKINGTAADYVIAADKEAVVGTIVISEV